MEIFRAKNLPMRARKQGQKIVATVAEVKHFSSNTTGGSGKDIAGYIKDRKKLGYIVEVVRDKFGVSVSSIKLGAVL